MNNRQQLNPLSSPENRLPVSKCGPEQIQLYNNIMGLAAHDIDGTEYVLQRALSELIGDSIPLLNGAKMSKASPTKSWLLKGRSAKGDWSGLGFDHQMPLILSDGTRAILGEPYDLHCKHFDEIESLRSEGFRITVSGRSQHYPLRTVSVIIQPPASSQAISGHGNE